MSHLHAHGSGVYGADAELGYVVKYTYTYAIYMYVFYFYVYTHKHIYSYSNFLLSAMDYTS